MRYDPQFSTIKKMYDNGDLGEIILAEAHYVHDMRLIYQIFIQNGISNNVCWRCAGIRGRWKCRVFIL